MKKIVAVYTAGALVEPLKRLHNKINSDIELINIVDDSLIQEVINEGKVTANVKRRLLKYYEAGIYDIKGDIILNTCSSVGEVVDVAREIFDKTPIVKIDKPMAKKAVKNAKRIGVLATLPTTLNPTIRLLKKQADKLNKECEIIEGLAEGAFKALNEGQEEKHDELIIETACDVSENVDLIVLAQGSMARMKNELNDTIDKPVLTSPESGLRYAKSLL